MPSAHRLESRGLRDFLTNTGATRVIADRRDRRARSPQREADTRLNLLNDLESSSLSDWLSTSMLGVPLSMGLHSVGMAVVVGLSLMVTLRLWQIITGFDERLIPRFLTIAIWGFVLNLATGIAIFITRAAEYVLSYMFLFKMLLVVIGIAILFALRRRLRAGASAPAVPAADATARALSLVSTIAFFGAVITGRLIAYLSDLY
jgi:hypothetical protein